MNAGEALADPGLKSKGASGNHRQSFNSPLLMFVVPLPQPQKDTDMPDFDTLIYEKPERASLVSGLIVRRHEMPRTLISSTN